MAHVLSQNAKAYRNTGTYASPTWSEITLVKDLTLNLTKDKADVTTRGSGGYKEFVDGLKDASVEFSHLWDTSDAHFTALRTAYTANTAVEVLILDGTSATSGAQGLRAHMMVESFTRNETLGEALMVDVTLSPVKNTNAAPAWFTVT